MYRRNLCRILLVFLNSRDVEVARKFGLTALQFGIRARVGLAISATRTLETSYTIVQTIDISSDGTSALISHIIYIADGATYSFVTAVLALSLWYKHISGRLCRLLQVPHTGITPSHLIFRTLHASQARATLRRRRASFCRTSTLSG
jgi:hypothetical protein